MKLHFKLTFGLLLFTIITYAQGQQTGLSNDTWEITVSPTTGAIISISNHADKTGMNWVHAKYQWGILSIANGNDTISFNKPTILQSQSGSSETASYQTNGLTLNVARLIDAKNVLNESYTLTNVSAKTQSFPKGTVGITVPFYDSYDGGAAVALTQRANTHIWANGSGSYINAIRMDGEAPNLGLVFTQGSLAGYSLAGATFSNDRGKISLNPEAITLKPGQSYTLAWKLFWHRGWNDFWKQALAIPGFVLLKADQYTVLRGEKIKINGESASILHHISLLQNGKNIPLQLHGKTFSASVIANRLGEQLFELHHDGRTDRLLANVVENPMQLIKARVSFIIDKQQRIDPGSNLDGAYLIYDNETEKQFWASKNDYNEARERTGMGVLLALYLPYCKDEALRTKIVASLKRFEAFIAREIQDTAGVVYNASHYKDSHRIYNSPWVGHFHLAMYWATKDVRYLHLFAKTVKAYYGKSKGVNFKSYPIGLQVMDGLKALQEAGLNTEYSEVYECFSNHASTIAEIGGKYPQSEVAYEQSIVAPGVQISLEMYLVTKDVKFLNSAKAQMSYLEAFNGQQPDYRLNNLAIRHWDDYWFGKFKAYGDTFPHYWQTVSAIAFDEFAEAGAASSYREKAQQILYNNLCLFEPNGRAHCAYLFPLNSMNVQGQRFDPWANDQDWALVNLLTLYNRGHLKF